MVERHGQSSPEDVTTAVLSNPNATLADLVREGLRQMISMSLRGEKPPIALAEGMKSAANFQEVAGDTGGIDKLLEWAREVERARDAQPASHPPDD